MTEFDLASLSVRIVECTRCHEPVLGERAAGRMSLTCGYCGFADERELSSRRAADDDGPSAYRGKPRTEQGRLIKVDLEEPPAGLSAKSLGRDALKTMWREGKAALGDAVESGRADAEYRLLWIGTMLSSHHVTARDHLHARAALETLLELVTIAPYRALVLARLARLAAHGGAPDLADKWLAAAPRELRIAEVTSELRVTEALIARARNDAKGMLDAIRERDTANDFVGGARWLAVALRVDAYEQSGEDALATKLWRETKQQIGPKNALALDAAARAYGLAPKTRRRSQLVAIPAILGLVMLVYGLVMLVRGFLNDSGVIGYVPLGLVVTGLLLAMLFKRL